MLDYSDTQHLKVSLDILIFVFWKKLNVVYGLPFTMLFLEFLMKNCYLRLKHARKRGKTPGRKRKMTNSKINMAIKSLQEGIPVKEVAESLHVSVPTLYRWCPASAIENTDKQNKEDLNEEYERNSLETKI